MASMIFFILEDRFKALQGNFEIFFQIREG